MTELACSCEIPLFWGYKRLCKKCGNYEEAEVITTKPALVVPDVPEEFLQFGDSFTKHLRKKGPCVLFVMHTRSTPVWRKQQVRHMFVDVPEGWFIRSACGEFACIEPEHQVISPNIRFSDTIAPIKFKFPRKRKIRSYRQFEQEFMEV